VVRRSAPLVFALLLVVALAAAVPGQYKPEFKMSLVVGPAGPWGEAATRFSELVRERTQGRINVKPYFAGQLFAGRQTTEFLLLVQGVADFAIGSTINWSPQVKELNLFSLPFLFPGDKAYRALDAVQQSDVGKRLFQIIESKGVIPLAWGENGFRQLTNSVRPVRRPQDLQNLKIRVVGSPIFIDIFRFLGANPVSMNWAEAQTAFAQGTVDGQENPVNSVIIPFKLWTTQKYITVWNYVVDPLILGMSKQSWDTLSPQDKDIVRRTAVEVMARQKREARAGLEGSLEALETLKKNGMEVIVLTPEEVEAFRQATLPVYRKWKQEIGRTLVEAAEQVVRNTR
jgi:tripartite ATP-independent transporter DctP family solute receptor